MTDAAQVALLVLAGLLAGLLIPLVVSARALFKRADGTLERLEPKLAETLDEVRGLVRRGDELLGAVGPAAPKIAVLVDRLDRLVDGLDGARSSSVMARAAGSALGAALATGWSTYLAHRQAAVTTSEEFDAHDDGSDEAEASNAVASHEPVIRDAHGARAEHEAPERPAVSTDQAAPPAMAAGAGIGVTQAKNTGANPEAIGGHSPAQ